jgi:hypothetical protein
MQTAPPAKLPMAGPGALLPAPVGCVPLRVAVFLATAVFACSIYVNLSFAVTRPADYRFFPPFQP